MKWTLYKTVTSCDPCHGNYIIYIFLHHASFNLSKCVVLTMTCARNWLGSCRKLLPSYSQLPHFIPPFGGSMWPIRHALTTEWLHLPSLRLPPRAAVFLLQSHVTWLQSSLCSHWIAAGYFPLLDCSTVAWQQLTFCRHLTDCSQTMVETMSTTRFTAFTQSAQRKPPKKMVKPYKRFQSQVKIKRPSVLASLMLIRILLD